jgi:hypothetical protein
MVIQPPNIRRHAVFPVPNLVRTTFPHQPEFSTHFGTVCDCNWRDGKSKRFQFKTIAAVKAELRKLGYRRGTSVFFRNSALVSPTSARWRAMIRDTGRQILTEVF